MSAYQEANHDMTDRDIALLLADAADGVEIGIAPTQAVIRGGRRRRARRWAVATAAALAIVGATGTVALAGLPGGDGHRGAPVATQPPTTKAPRLNEPQRTKLASGTEDGEDWEVSVDVWGAPRNAAEAQAQLTAMTEDGDFPGDIRKASELVGKSSFFVHRIYGDTNSVVIFNSLAKGDAQADTDLDAGSARLKPASDGPVRLVVGRVAKTAQEVTCYWKDGTRTRLHRIPANGDSDKQGIRSAEGSSDNWFVCLAPKSTGFKEVFVTKLG